MSRVVEIRDARTVVVQTNALTAVVILREVSIHPEDEAAAAAYLRRQLAGAWVYVENGDLYRSPDGLHINAAMRRRAWTGAIYLGEFDPGRAISKAPPAANERSSRPRSTPRRRRP